MPVMSAATIVVRHHGQKGLDLLLAASIRRGTQLETVLKDGRTLTMNGLFTQPRTLMSRRVAEQLGCTLADGAMGLFIQVDEGKATSVPNVFTCGDAARTAGNVALAVAAGAMTGFGAHRGLMG